MSRWVAVLCGLVLAAHAAPAAADAVVGTGTAASCNEAALNNAVNTVVPNGGVIRFNCGGPATINITTQKLFFWPDNPALVYGIDGGGVITLNAQGLTRHILHLSGTLNIVNITFTNGHARGVSDIASGGAIRSDRNVAAAVGLNLNNVTFTNNQGDLTGVDPGLHAFDSGGGAVFLRLVFATVVNCTFVSNVCNNCAGGALHGRSAGFSVSGSFFGSNSSNGGGLGGAIHVDGVTVGGTGGSLQISTSTFSNNTALGEGGAGFFYLHPGQAESLVFDTVSVVGNRVVDSGQIDFVGNNGFGGGICTNNGTIVIRNSTISGNSARGTVAVNGPGIGGGAAVSGADAVTIVNSTISGNRAFGGGSVAQAGGLMILGNAQAFQMVHSTVTLNQTDGTAGGILGTNGVLTNTIVANNTAAGGSGTQQCSHQISNGGGALMFPDNTPRCANAILVANPVLGALASNGGFTQTHLPQSGSAAINAVGCAAATDQRGVARPQGSACEIGSVEVTCNLGLSPLTLPTGRVGTAYSQAITVSGANGSPTLSLTGTLPSGITFSGGVLSGTPSQSGNFVITVNASDSSCTVGRTYNLAVASTTAVNPTALSVDAAGNGVLEANQTVTVAPTWSNTTGAPVTLTGSAGSFIGLAGATYTINDGSAAYGTVANNASASCTGTGNCYAMTIAAGTRPASHWDASFAETMSAGGPKAWTLHVGGSFTDVPASNGFYRTIEILLHRGITGGCGPSTYCPTSSTTRDQMAVFVLVAKEGSGYSPVACSPPNTFADVPQTSPFCRWIEELARRGVVSGCGGGNYCPTTAVTRDQMAVFVLRTLDPALNPPACGTPMFNDVPAGNAFCKWIEELARRGVVSGCGGGNYCPSSPVTRDQMGVFLSATFGLTLYGP